MSVVATVPNFTASPDAPCVGPEPSWPPDTVPALLSVPPLRDTPAPPTPPVVVPLPPVPPVMLPVLVTVPAALKLTPTPPLPPTLPLLPAAPWIAPLFVRLFPAPVLSTAVAPATVGATTPVLVMVS